MPEIRFVLLSVGLGLRIPTGFLSSWAEVSRALFFFNVWYHQALKGFAHCAMMNLDGRR